MITCPKCNKEMHNVYEDEEKEMVVYYCCGCDYRLVLHECVKRITWYTEERKQ